MIEELKIGTLCKVNWERILAGRDPNTNLKWFMVQIYQKTAVIDFNENLQAVVKIPDVLTIKEKDNDKNWIYLGRTPVAGSQNILFLAGTQTIRLSINALVQRRVVPH